VVLDNNRLAKNARQEKRDEASPRKMNHVGFVNKFNE
jgi:hypothetical protein